MSDAATYYAAVDVVADHILSTGKHPDAYDTHAIVDEVFNIADSMVVMYDSNAPWMIPEEDIELVIESYPWIPVWGPATRGDQHRHEDDPNTGVVASAPWRGLRIMFGVESLDGRPPQPNVWVEGAPSPFGGVYGLSLPTHVEQAMMLRDLGVDEESILPTRPDWCDCDWWGTAVLLAGRAR